MRMVFLLVLWAALSLPGCGSGVHIQDGCRVACCGCSSDADCDEPRRCWPVTINGDTFHVCEASDEICVPSTALMHVSARTIRLSFLPRFASQAFDFSRGVSSAVTPAPAEGDVQVTGDGILGGEFVRTRDGRPSAVAIVGPVQSLSEIREAPLDGYAPAAAVIVGHGYVVRCQENAYARCRAVEPILEVGGSLVGWIFEWSYQGDGSRTFAP